MLLYQTCVSSPNVEQSQFNGCSEGVKWFFKKLIIFWLCWAFVAAGRLSLVVSSRGYALVSVWGLLIVVASPVAEPKL